MKYSIGTTYEGKNDQYLKNLLPHIDHIEVSPDSISRYVEGRIEIHPSILSQLQWLACNTSIEILVHGVGLSIGSHEGCNPEYLQLLDQLLESIPSVKWHSEHLAYTRVNEENLGTMLTLPRTDEVVELISRRVDYLQKKYKKPFLLENVASMLPDSAGRYSHACFLNEITMSTGCGLILDVYNMECDAYNFGFQITPFLEELDLNSVYELHLAAGAVDQEYDFKMDVHSRLLSPSTLEWTKKIIRKATSNLSAITYEILEEFLPQVGEENVIHDLKKLRMLSLENAT